MTFGRWRRGLIFAEYRELRQMRSWQMVLLLLLAVSAITPGIAQAQTAGGEAPSSLTETYKNWTVRCATPAAIKGQKAPTRICEMMQELRQKKTGQRLLVMALQPSKAEGASLTFIAPFGLLLSKGLKVAVDGTDVAKGGFRTCLPRGCISVINLAQGPLDKLVAGDTATIAMVGTGGREITLAVSLAGFAAAWNRLNGI